MLIVGGLDSLLADDSPYAAGFNSPDNFKQGIGIFDMSTLQFKDGYDAGALQYVRSTPVGQIYNGTNGNQLFSLQFWNTNSG